MNNNNLIPPDYSESEYPKEEDSDVLEEILIEEEEEERDRRTEALLDAQAFKNEKIDMSNNWESTQSPWSTSGSQAPWSNNSQKSTNAWGSGWNSNNDNNSSWWSSTQQDKGTKATKIGHRDVVICDALDCLFESYTSGGRPNVNPRAVFDLRPRFDVWDRLASLSPNIVCVMFPNQSSIPSFGSSKEFKVVIEYVLLCLSSYLRIDRNSCVALQAMRPNQPKDKLIKSALNLTGISKENTVYVGVYGGDWDLSDSDKLVAERSGVDFMSIFKLLGKV